MALDDCPHPALQLDVVLEKILEYAASGVALSKSLNLRMVCKQWREMSFKGLCCSTLLPTIRLRQNNICIWPIEMTLETFRKHFPKTCPAHIALSDSKIPIKLIIDHLPLSGYIAFIREFSCYIASVVILPDLKPEEDNQLNESPSYDFKLPNLRRLYANWCGEGNNGLTEQFVKHILDTANRVGVVEYEYHHTYPVIHPKVTNIMTWIGLATDLRRLRFPVVKQLAQLSLILILENLHQDPYVECVAIADILARHSSTLQDVTIYHGASFRLVKALRLPCGQLRELRALKTDFPILLNKDKSNPGNLPKLKILKCTIGYHTEEESDGFKVSHLAANSLVSLHLNWDESLTPRNITAEEEENRKKEIVQTIEEENFPVYTELLELTIDNVPFSFAQALIPKVFHCMTNLIFLSVQFEQKPGSLLKDYTDDVLNILTGMTPNDIPKDEALWPDSLKNKTNAITNLKNLISLEIKSCTSSNCVLGRFIFFAAFNQMKKFKRLFIGDGGGRGRGVGQSWVSVN